VVNQDGHCEGEQDEKSDHFVASWCRPYCAVLACHSARQMPLVKSLISLKGVKNGPEKAM
jgi:hypothetical protein